MIHLDALWYKTAECLAEVRSRRSLRIVLVLALAASLSACATATVQPGVRPEATYALPAAPDGPFADLEATIHAEHGLEASGFMLLDRNEEALRWRLALLDSATQSIDVQYYLWYGDAAGQILAKRLLDAADRGVKVRMLVDDLNTLISDAVTVTLRDHVVAWIDAHPNVEVRLFNPWNNRDLAGRIGEALTDLGRVNTRMHNKAMVVDNRAAILGGRNIGNEYMGLSTSFNFHDLDVLGIGPVARQTSAVFDAFWNSEWAFPASALGLAISPKEQLAGRSELVARLDTAESLIEFPIAPQSWASELTALEGDLHVGTSRVYSDWPRADGIEHVMFERMQAMLWATQDELLIVNAYIIPSDQAISQLRRMEARGVEIKILTNSLASHDVPAVNSHYKPWRRPLLEAGSELYEMRHDAEIKSRVADTPPTHARFMGLHSKAAVVDRHEVYIGSMNYDPRSAQINTEMGVFIESSGLAEALSSLIERDIDPANSWKVVLDGQSGLRWINETETVKRQPARHWWQRVEDILFRAFPEEYY